MLGIYSKDRPETKIVKATSSAPEHIRLTWERVKPEDLKSMQLAGCDKLTIAVKSDMPLGTFREEVVVTTDHPKQPELRLIVTGTLLGPVSLGTPGRLMIINPPVNGKLGGSGRARPHRRREPRDEVRGGQGPQGAQGRRATGRGLEAQGPLPAGRHRPPGTPAQNIIDRVELKTDHPKAAYGLRAGDASSSRTP